MLVVVLVRDGHPISCSKRQSPASATRCACRRQPDARHRTARSPFARRAARAPYRPRNAVQALHGACRTSGCIVSCCDSSSIITPWRKAPCRLDAVELQQVDQRLHDRHTAADHRAAVVPESRPAARDRLAARRSAVASRWPWQAGRDGAVGQTLGAQHVRHRTPGARGAVDRSPNAVRRALRLLPSSPPTRPRAASKLRAWMRPSAKYRIDKSTLPTG